MFADCVTLLHSPFLLREQKKKSTHCIFIYYLYLYLTLFCHNLKIKDSEDVKMAFRRAKELGFIVPVISNTVCRLLPDLFGFFVRSCFRKLYHMHGMARRPSRRLDAGPQPL